MGIDITYDGGLSEVSARLSESIETIIAAGAQCVCDNAKAACPVDTGTLRESIGAECDGRRAEIYADTDYAAYVEFGTSKMSPQPYLIPSLIDSEAAVLEAMAQAITDI